MNVRLVLERFYKGKKEEFAFILKFGKFIQLPDSKMPKATAQQWVNADEHQLQNHEMVLAKGSVWIEDDKSNFIGVFETAEDYIDELRRFFGEKNITVKELTKITLV